MLESDACALTEAMDGAARIASLERELDLLRHRDAERTAEFAARATDPPFHQGGEAQQRLCVVHDRARAQVKEKPWKYGPYVR